MKNILEKITKERLIDFIMEHANSDKEFANVVNVYFGTPNFNDELNKIEKAIDKALSGASDYRNSGGWGYISIDTSNIVSEIRQRAEQGHVQLAFAEIELLYCQLLELFEYQEECEISEKIEYCLEIMYDIADKATLDDDKSYIFNRCIVLSELEDGKDFGADYDDKLLRISAKFVTQENLTKLERVLENSNCKWRQEELTLIHLEIIQKLEGDNAADVFISENLQFPKIRDIAFDKAIALKNFEEAERLCIGALTEYTQRHVVSAWLHKLYSVYETTGNISKMADVAKKILFHGNLEYYDKLKVLLNELGAWDTSYSELICECESSLSYSQYARILAKENEYKLLLESVKKHTEMIYTYGKLLAEKYPTDICAVFSEQISSSAEEAYGREAYSKVCSRILCFIDAGYKAESTELIKEFKLKYKRKPAFIDELNKIKI